MYEVCRYAAQLTSSLRLLNYACDYIVRLGRNPPRGVRSNPSNPYNCRTAFAIPTQKRSDTPTKGSAVRRPRGTRNLLYACASFLLRIYVSLIYSSISSLHTSLAISCYLGLAHGKIEFSHLRKLTHLRDDYHI